MFDYELSDAEGNPAQPPKANLNADHTTKPETPIDLKYHAGDKAVF
jgi:hypothetical protein